MTAHGDREQGASNLPVILVLIAAAVILVLVLSLRGGEEEEAPARPSAEGQRSPSAAQPPIAVVPSPATPGQPASGERTEVAQEGHTPSALAGQRRDAPDRDRGDRETSDANEPWDREPGAPIPLQYVEALENPPEMPESLRLAIERGEINQVPPEYQAALDGPGPQISPELLEMLHRNATEQYIPPDVLEQFQEAGRRMNAGRQ